MKNLILSHAKHSSVVRMKVRIADIKKAQRDTQEAYRALVRYIDEHELTFLLPSERGALTPKVPGAAEPQPAKAERTRYAHPGYVGRRTQARVTWPQTRRLRINFQPRAEDTHSERAERE